MLEKERKMTEDAVLETKIIIKSISTNNNIDLVLQKWMAPGYFVYEI